MIVGNIDNALDGAPKIVTGSLQGTLRVHNPELYNSGAVSAQDASLLLEVQLEAPVLHLKLGRLLPGDSGRLGVAVLHPQRLAVYGVEMRQVNPPQIDQSKPEPDTVMGTTRLPQHHELVAHFSHYLSANGKEFDAFNLCVGPFCGSNEHNDSIVVQSLQCSISVFAQNTEIFSRQLHQEFVLPGPFEYVVSCNGFVIQNTSFEVELYKCGALMGVGHDSSCASLVDGSCHRKHPVRTHDSSKSATMMVPSWSIDIGEVALYMLVGTMRATTEDIRPSEGIICIGERNIFMLSPRSGALLAQAGLNYEAISPCTYNPDRFVSGRTRRRGDFVIVGETNGNVHFLATPCETKSIVRPGFEDSSAPLTLAVFDMPRHPGMIVMLDDFGRLSLSYLGNQRATSALSTRKGNFKHDVNVANIEAELNNLELLTVSAANSTANSTRFLHPRFDYDGVECSNKFNADMVVVIREVSTALMFRYAPTARCMEFGRSISSEVHAAKKPWVFRCEPEATTQWRSPPLAHAASSGYDVALRVTASHLESATKVHTPEWTYCVVGATLHPGTCSTFLKAKLYTRTCLSPTSIEAMATASYTSVHNARRAATTAFRLPMGLYSYVFEPSIQEANFRLIIDTSREAVSLNILFDDLLQQDSAGFLTATSTISFVFCFTNGQTAFHRLLRIPMPAPMSTEKRATASILVTKQRGRYRYRLDAAVIPAMWLVADELCRRLTAHWSGAIKIAFNGDIPLSDLASLIDAYHAARARLQAASVKLCYSSLGLTDLEMRVLARCKDLLPSSVESAWSALKCKYGAVTACVNDVSYAQQECDRIARILAASLRLILLRIRFKFSFTEEHACTLNLYFCPDVFVYNLTAAHDPGAGWEELVSASLCFLLKAFSTEPDTRREVLCDIHWNPWSTENDHTASALTQVDRTTLLFPTSTEKLKRYFAVIIRIMPAVKLQLVALGCLHFARGVSQGSAKVLPTMA
eukprot:CAMPEP_0198659740 /NCGR_PEP_ID=MMETSP1467-20131203/33564_1 /TAXON_ID=1462469 /ORGANISM="unid. sp., Strain CCMP2135" /LENGTH=979 /DNA_ID=CAMNT_0044396115 /DNA_START=1 /DNA_END=2940 /DNA_ORIENTATION=-